MLDEMHIANVALIRDTLFQPSSGMTVITGETGSGKTALLNALKLLVGERANAGMIREGAAELAVEGRFFLESVEADEQEVPVEDGGPAQQGVSAEHSEPVEQEMVASSEDGTVVCRRVGLNGRSRVTIDGSLAGVKDLAAGVGASIDLCGQHEHQQLLNAAYQRKLFDRWGASSIGSWRSSAIKKHSMRVRLRRRKSSVCRSCAKRILSRSIGRALPSSRSLRSIRSLVNTRHCSKSFRSMRTPRCWLARPDWPIKRSRLKVACSRSCRTLRCRSIRSQALMERSRHSKKPCAKRISCSRMWVMSLRAIRRASIFRKTSSRCGKRAFQRFRASCAAMVQRWMRSSQPSLKRTSSLLLMIRVTNCSRKRSVRARKLKIGLFRQLMRSRLLAKRWCRAFLLRSPLRWHALRWGALLW